MREQIGKDRRVLVVDDEEVLTRVLQRFLAEQGFAVETAGTVSEAMDKLARQRFDLLVVDKNLPDGTGLDLASQLGDDRDHELILITGYPNVSSAVEALRHNVIDYIPKPLDLTDFTSRLSRVLAIQDLKRRNRQLIAELQEKNQALALDPLTRLNNHAYFQDALQKEVLRSRRHGLDFSVVFIDVDEFKGVNDTYGHLAGDRVLTEFADILRGRTHSRGRTFRLRESDVAARYGGDEFALVMPETPQAGAALKAEALRVYVEEYDFAGHGMPPITISVGVASFPRDGADPVTLISAADRALYAAKEGGRNRIVSFLPALSHEGTLRALEAQAEAARLEGLERSISHHSFEFHYQPIVDAESWSVFGYEALCRPTDGVFAEPTDLIAIAERAGRISTLGRVLRERSVEPMARLPEPRALFINLHPLEFNDPSLLDLEPYLDPWRRRIIFEVTETARIRDYTRAREVIARLREHGFRIALDDIGSGYAGLNSLALLEPDFVKLDMAMIRGLQAHGRTARLIKHLLEFARGEGMQVIAEGVETAEEVRAVTDLGVPLMQGFYFAHPGPPFVSPRRRR